MPHSRDDAERRTAEGGVQFSDQLLESILPGAVGAAEVAVQARGVATGVTEFVQRRAVPVNRMEIGGRRWHLHVVFGRRVEGAVAADAEVDAGCPDQRFHGRLDQSGRWRRCGGRDLFREIIALIGIKDGESLQERDRLRFFVDFGGAALLVLWHEAVGIDNRRAVLALADMTTER